MSRTALEQLAKLDAAIRQTAGEIAEAERGHDATRKELAAAEDALRDLSSQPNPDPAEQDRLIAAVARIQSRMVPDPYGGKGRKDVAVQARVAQLKKAEGLQRQRRAGWIEDNARALQAELIAKAKASRDGLHDAIRHLQAASQAWETTAAEWQAVSEGLGYARHEVPWQSPARDGLSMLAVRLSQKPDVPAPQRAVGPDAEFTFDARTPVGAAQ